MSEDGWLIGLVSAIWIALAALYAFVPMFDMPGSALVWGSGAAIFLALTALVARAEGRARHKPFHPQR
jgi:Na+-driven multidrug efflux pump